MRRRIKDKRKRKKKLRNEEFSIPNQICHHMESSHRNRLFRQEKCLRAQEK